MRIIHQLALVLFLLSFTNSAWANEPDTSQAFKDMVQAIKLTKSEQFDQAEVLMESAVATYKAAELWDTYLEAKTYLIQLHTQKYFTHGEVALERSKEFAEELIKESVTYLGVNNKYEASANESIGWYYNYLGFPEKALPYFERDLEIAMLNMDSTAAVPAQQGVRYYNLADICKSTGKLDQAVDYFNKAAEIFASYMDKEGPMKEPTTFNYANVQIMLSICYQSLRKYELAREIGEHARSFAEARSSENRSRMAFIYETLGNTHQATDQHQQAIDYFQTAVDICKESPNGNQPLIARIYTTIGDSYKELNELRQALNYYLKAETIYQNLEGDYHASKISLQLRLGQLYYLKKDYGKSLEILAQALEQQKTVFGDKPNKSISYLYGAMGRCHFQQEDYTKALELTQQASRYALVAKELNSTPSNTELIFDAQSHFWDKTNALELVAVRAAIFLQLYQQNKEAHYLVNAEQHILFAIQEMDAMRLGYTESEDKKALFRDMQNIYQQGVDIFWERYQSDPSLENYEQIFHLAEKNKSVLLSEALQNEQTLSFGGVPQKVIQQEKKLSMQLAQYEQKLIDIQVSNQKKLIEFYQEKILELHQQIEKLHQKIQKDYPNYHQLKYNNQEVRISAIQKFLGKEVLFLEYFIGTEAIYLFAIDQENYTVKKIDFKDYRAQIKEFRNWLVNPTYGTEEGMAAAIQTFSALAEDFYQKLIAPAKPKAIKQLIIVPDGDLNYIPFEALVTQKTENAEHFGQLAYLIKDYAIYYGFSANLLLQQAKISQENTLNNAKVLAFAASYNAQSTNATRTSRSLRTQTLRNSLADLPAARSEVKKLEEMFDGQFFYGDHAHEDNFRANAPNYPVIHLAMHGFLDKENPMLSSLIFTENGDSIQDNLLHAYELSNMQLHANLVVLSACETGYGKFEQGEGVISLARSFMYAGVPSLIMSLWQVNDQATSLLMQEFYTNLKKGMTKSEALRQAKLSYLKHSSGLSSHPSLWAAFVQTGNDDPIPLGKSNTIWWYLLGAALLLGLFGFLMIRRKKQAV